MRFSIRDLLWATLVVALCLGWLMSYRATEARHDEEFNTLYAQVKEAANMAEERVQDAQVKEAITQANRAMEAAEIARVRAQAKRLSELRQDLGNELSRRAEEKAKSSV